MALVEEATNPNPQIPRFIFTALGLVLGLFPVPWPCHVTISNMSGFLAWRLFLKKDHSWQQEKVSLFHVQTLDVGRVLNYWHSFRQYGCNCSSFSSFFGSPVREERFRPTGRCIFELARFSRLMGPGELADFLILTYNARVKCFKCI